MQTKTNYSSHQRLVAVLLLFCLVGCTGISQQNTEEQPENTSPTSVHQANPVPEPKLAYNTQDSLLALQSAQTAMDAPLQESSRAVLLEDFNSYEWVSSPNNSSAVGIAYSKDHSTDNGDSMKVSLPIEQKSTFADRPKTSKTVQLKYELPVGQDWTEYDFLTFDVYAEQSPLHLSSVAFDVIDSKGNKSATFLILGWRLFRWENKRMTVPFNGNTHVIPPLDPEILKDVRQVAISFVGYGDNHFEALDFHLDNFALNGSKIWDDMDESHLKWTVEGGNTKRSGIHFFPDDDYTRGGVMRLDVPKGSQKPVTLTGKFSTNALYSDMRALDTDNLVLDAQIHCDCTGSAVVELFDGQSTWRSPAVEVSAEDNWEDVQWPISQATINVQRLQSIKITVTPSSNTGEAILFDTVQLSSPGISNIRTIPVPDGNIVEWNSIDARLYDEIVLVRTTGIAEHPSDGTIVCSRRPNDQQAQSCLDAQAPKNAKYAFYPIKENTFYSAIVHTAKDDAFLSVNGNGYSIGFEKDNGAIAYIVDTKTNRIVSTGSAENALWEMRFMETKNLAKLSAADFNTSSSTKRFRYTESPLQLKYAYINGDDFITVQVDITEQNHGIDLKATVNNDSSRKIRLFSLTPQLQFASESVERVLYPVQEGLVLLRDYFINGRNTYMPRPPLFADILALESVDGYLATYVIQDSYYTAEDLPHHPANTPVFQPNNLGVGTNGKYGYFQTDMITLIPEQYEGWQSPTFRISVGRNLRQLAEDYSDANGMNNTKLYPTLQQKLEPFGAYEKLSRGAILAIEVYKMVEWLKSPEKEVWKTLLEAVDTFPTPAVIHLTHWQPGKLEHNHPDAQPIDWQRNGPEKDFMKLMEDVEQRGFLRMPFTNWTVWNKEHIVKEEGYIPESALKLNRDLTPFQEYEGYMVKPWHSQVRKENDKLIETYTEKYPQDLLFIDMTGERTWRYVRGDETTPDSVSLYTQAVINENVRLSKHIPLFTEGVFDRIANSISGYCQTLRQKRWNGVLEHLGPEFEDWIPYPFAADVTHDLVAFYPHNLNLEVWAGVDMHFLSYYMAYGYNIMVDVSSHLFEDEHKIHILNTFQKVVGSRTFGQKLLDYQLLTPDGRRVKVRWGTDEEYIDVLTNFDPPDGEGVYSVGSQGEYAIVPDAFFAQSKDGETVAGIFTERFNGQPLPSGEHWIAVEHNGDYMSIYHMKGQNTPLTITLPQNWSGDSVYLTAVTNTKNEYILSESHPIENGKTTVEITSNVQGTWEGILEYRLYQYKPDNAVHVQEAQLVSPFPSMLEWNQYNATIGTFGDFYVITEQGEEAFGKIDSGPLSLPLGVDPILKFSVKDVAPGSSISVQVQQEQGEYESFNLLSDIVKEGEYSMQFSSIMSSRQLQNTVGNFSIAIWVSGESSSILFSPPELVDSN